MPVLAKDAVIGVVYLTPKGRALERIARAVDADPEDDTVPFRRLDDGSTFGVAPDYLLTPKPVEAAPSRVDSLKGLRIDDVIAAVVGSVEPFASVPLTDDELEELLASDTRGRVQRAIAEEGARRAAGGRPVPAAVEAVMPALPFDSAAFGGPVPVEVKPAEVVALESIVADAVLPFAGAPLNDATRDAMADAVADAVVDVLHPSSDQPPVDIVAASAGEQTDTPFPPIEVNHTISATSGSSEDRSGGGEAESDDAASAPADDLPFPASTPPAAEPVTVQVGGATTATTDPATRSETNTPEPAPAADPSATTPPAGAHPPKPAKERPRGYCPACRQHLTVRADGTMMAHFTPDGAKGADGKRLDCQGVGLAPRAERPDEPRLPLPVAMGAESPAAPIIERAALAFEVPANPVDAANAAREMGDAFRDARDALDSFREHGVASAVCPVAVPVGATGGAAHDWTGTPIPARSRYTLGGHEPYGWAIHDLVRCDVMRREDGTPAVWEQEADAQAALVYVREHGELPDGTQPDDPAPVPLDSASTCGHPAGYVDGRCAACDADEPGEVGRLARQVVRAMALVDKLANDNRELRNRPTTVVNNAPTTSQACDAIDTLTRHVADAKGRGVRVRIVIEPIE